jgi:hypothetical protein
VYVCFRMGIFTRAPEGHVRTMRLVSSDYWTCENLSGLGTFGSVLLVNRGASHDATI